MAGRDGKHTVSCEPVEASVATCEIEVLSTDATTGNPAERVLLETALRRGFELLGHWSPEAYRRADRELTAAYHRGLALGSADLVVDALMGRATRQQLANEWEESVPVLEEAVERATASDDRRRAVLTTVRLASSLAMLGKVDRAHVRAQKAMRAARDLGFTLGKAHAHLAVGDVHYLRAELQDARKQYQRAFEMHRQLGNSVGMIEAQLGLGYAWADLSEDTKARAHLEQARDLAHARGDKRHEAIALRVLGNVHSKLSEQRETIRCFEAARELFEEAEDRGALARLYNGLGEVHGRLNDLDVALQYHQKAEVLARETGQRVTQGVALVEIAECQRRLGRAREAAESYGKARDLFASIGDSGMVAASLAGLGNLLAADGESERAIASLSEALALMRAVGDSRQSSAILGDLADTFLSMGRIPRAREAAREALALAREAADLTREARALFLLARAARDEGALEEAKQYVEHSLAVDESVRARVSNHELRALFFSGVEARHGFYVDLLMEMGGGASSGLFAQRALEASERARARVLLDRLGQAAPTAEGRDETLMERTRALDEAIRARALLTDLGAQESGEDDDARLREMLAERRRMEGLTGSAPPEELAAGLTRTLGLEEIRRELRRDDALLVEYLLGPDRSHVWIVSKDRFSSHVLPPREVIDTAARSLYENLTARQRDLGDSARKRRARAEQEDLRFYEAGAALAETLLGPIEDLDEHRRLIVVADSLLHYLPFSALPHPGASARGEGYQPLVLSHEVVRAPSLSAVVGMRNRSQTTGVSGPLGGETRRERVAVLADPVFTVDDPRVHVPAPGGVPKMEEDLLSLRATLRGADKGLGDLPRLLASRQEASAIAKAAPKTDVRIAMDFQATRSTAEEMLRESHEIVHFATHGLLNDEYPALSGIITSLVDEHGRLQDGFLRARDVYGLPIAADLVVLSACETALGRMLRGEGIAGLMRAFMHAGVDTLVASTWRVDDVATRELMAMFYRRLLVDRLDPASALRAAQIEMLERKATAPPFFWAAFEVHGVS
jgi:CHAT domain-containing protein